MRSQSKSRYVLAGAERSILGLGQLATAGGFASMVSVVDDTLMALEERQDGVLGPIFDAFEASRAAPEVLLRETARA